jgi:hypothetical protein
MYEVMQAVFHTRDVGTVIFSAIAFVFFAALIWHLTGVLNGAGDTPNSKSANRLAAMLGALCGWIIGIAFAPFSYDEKVQFAAISSVVSAFLSGYVVSKVDRFVEGVLFPVDEKSRASWVRVGIFTAALLLVSVTVFVNRQYAFQLPAAVPHGGGTSGVAAVAAASAAASNVLSMASVSESVSTQASGVQPLCQSTMPSA